MKIIMTKDEVMKTLLDSLPVNLETQNVSTEISDWNTEAYLTVTINEETK